MYLLPPTFPEITEIMAAPYIYNQQLKLGSAAGVWRMQSMTILTHAGAKLFSCVVLWIVLEDFDA